MRMQQRRGRGNTVDGVQTYVSRACKKGIRMKMPFARPTIASFFGFRGAVGTGPDGMFGTCDGGAHIGWRWGLSINFRVGTRNRRSTQ